MRAEVTVLGAGVMGLTAALALARRGARVRVIDPGGIGAGASGGVVGALAPHAPDRWDEGKAFQLRALAMAVDFWAGVEATGGVSPGFARSGRVQPLKDVAAVEKARHLARGAATHWGAGWGMEVIAATGAAWEPVSGSGVLLRDTLSARLFPRAALAALVAALRALGGEVAVGGPEQGMVLHASGVVGLDALGAEVGATVGQGVKGQAALLRAEGAGAPQVYAPGLHVVPHGGGLVAVGSTSETDWSDPTTPDERLEAVIRAARDLVPALRDAPVVERWAGLRPRAATRAALAGEWPEKKGHFILNGGFKTGFGLAPLLGEAMADLMLEGRNGLPQAFRPEALLAKISGKTGVSRSGHFLN